MRVRETVLPGVGIRYNLRFDETEELVILIENQGKRQVYWRTGPDVDSEKLFEVNESDARKLAEIFDGTYFSPVGDDIKDVFENARLRWIELPAEASIVGQTIGDAAVRSRTGVSIIAIERGEETITNPAKNTDLKAGDVLVVVGTDDQHDDFSALIKQES
jgi:TrkA domain protein